MYKFPLKINNINKEKIYRKGKNVGAFASTFIKLIYIFLRRM